MDKILCLGLTSRQALYQLLQLFIGLGLWGDGIEVEGDEELTGLLAEGRWGFRFEGRDNLLLYQVQELRPQANQSHLGRFLQSRNSVFRQDEGLLHIPRSTRPGPLTSMCILLFHQPTLYQISALDTRGGF